jgi:hypothetical protein
MQRYRMPSYYRASVMGFSDTVAGWIFTFGHDIF